MSQAELHKCGHTNVLTLPLRKECCKPLWAQWLPTKNSVKHAENLMAKISDNLKACNKTWKPIDETQNCLCAHNIDRTLNIRNFSRCENIYTYFYDNLTITPHKSMIFQNRIKVMNFFFLKSGLWSPKFSSYINDQYLI